MLLAHQFESLLLGVSMGRASLAGCTASEVAAEADYLRRAIAELRAATLRRKNPRLEERRAALIASGEDCLRSRGADVETAFC